MIHSFQNIAKLVRKYRLRKILTQEKLAFLLDYGGAQFISNVERAKCGIPHQRLKTLSKVLDIDMEEIKEAVASDVKDTIDICTKAR